MKFSILKNKKLPPEAQRGLLPRQEFLVQGKERFLAAFDARPLAGWGIARGASPRSGLATALRVGMGTFAAIAVAFGASAYAATAANVPPTNPLYPLKRLVENVQLAVAPPQAKAQLQATFAVQRANEIDALQAQRPTSTLIPQLTKDLDSEISSSLAAANQPASSSSAGGEATANVGAEGAVNVFCGAFVKSTSSVLFGHLESDLVLHPNILNQFNEQCGSGSRHGADTTGGTAASSTVNSIEPPGGLHGRGHQYGGVGDYSATDTSVSSAGVRAASSVSSSDTGSHGSDSGERASVGGGVNVSIPAVGGIL